MSDHDQSPANPDPGDAATPPEAEPPAEGRAPDEPPTEPVEAPTAPVEAPAAAADTESAPEESPPQAAPAAEPTPPPAAAGPSPTPVAGTTTGDQRRGVLVPAWVAVVAGALLVALLGFAIGWIAAPGDDDDASNAVATQPSPGADDRDTGDRDDGRERPGRPDRDDDDNDADDADDERTVPPLFRGGFLGVTVETVENDGGARITEVADDSPAADAGLQAGDVVTEVDDDDISSSLDLIRAIRGHEPGDRITITYTRNGTSADVEVTLAERSPPESVS